MINCCVCTHNPFLPTLELTIRALADQTLAPASYSVLIVDNASSPPLSHALLGPLEQKGIISRIVREEKLGIARARLRAFNETQADWVCFVDDDNVLEPEYLAEGVSFADAHPSVAAFGGRLLLPVSLSPSKWVAPFLPYLAIKDLGDEVLRGASDSWEVWEPPCAGAFVSRELLAHYARRIESDSNTLKLGREGTSNLSSCEDSLMMRGAASLGKELAYNPRLKLYHHLNPKRFEFRYLYRLMKAYGESHVRLERILDASANKPEETMSFGAIAGAVNYMLRLHAVNSLPFAVCMARYQLARWQELRRGRIK